MKYPNSGLGAFLDISELAGGRGGGPEDLYFHLPSPSSGSLDISLETFPINYFSSNFNFL